MKKLVSFLMIVLAVHAYGQESAKDSLDVMQLTEVLVVGTKTPLHEKQFKTLSSVDEFLQKSNKINLIKRGAYAWEPLINGMATERTVVTIDGMRIFGACTDKMDPITSYVEVSNLSEATVSSGQQGSCHGNTIGGSLDLKSNNTNTAVQGWDFDFLTGFEFNNKQKIVGGGVDYKKGRFYINTDAMFRDADNYKAGNTEEVQFSQFRKLNISATGGYQLAADKTMEASVIFDRATNVGYPSLPMDVSLAQALITSVKLEYKPINKWLQNWESKLYYNTIKHLMDDTKRPSVPIHMDMPGWSDTFGFYSNIKGSWDQHSVSANFNGFYNRSLAEMTMYPANPTENLMFMYTWPDVRTVYSGVYIEDNWHLSEQSSLKLATTLGFHSNHIASEFGLESLQIFYPDLADTRSRFLPSISTNYNYQKNEFSTGAGLALGERAPSVSEGYGFYLYNSFDNYDYIGNPNLKNEQSYEVNFYFGVTKKNWAVKITSAYFYLSNYILGIPDENVAPMTIGANGIKRYTAIDYATIWSNDLVVKYKLSPNWKWNAQLQYYIGRDDNNKSLPFMSPLAYSTSLEFSNDKWNAIFLVKGNATQTNFNAFYGEDKTPAYGIIDASVGRKVNWLKTNLQLNTGVENVLDANYSTYTDWNNLPRMGRNFFVNISLR